MQQVVVEAVDARVVGGGAEPGMVGHDQPEPLGEGKQMIEAERRARAVEVDERIAVARGEDGGVDPVDVDVVFLELRHHFTPAVASSRSPVFAPASRARILGITSSANSVRALRNLPLGHVAVLEHDVHAAGAGLLTPVDDRLRHGLG